MQEAVKEEEEGRVVLQKLKTVRDSVSKIFRKLQMEQVFYSEVVNSHIFLIVLFFSVTSIVYLLCPSPLCNVQNLKTTKSIPIICMCNYDGCRCIYPQCMVNIIYIQLRPTMQKINATVIRCRSRLSPNKPDNKTKLMTLASFI